MADLFDHPKKEMWEKRQSFVLKELENAEIGFSYLLSDHATALFMDMQIAYCAGAWLSVIVLSISVIDSHLRETESGDSKIGTAKLLSQYYLGEDIDWLRKLRNQYVHINLEEPIFVMNDRYTDDERLEECATKAMKMTIKALFQNPGT